MKDTRWRWIAVYVFAVLLASAPALAQTNTGQISGTVKDTSGAVLPGVSVTVTNVNTGLQWTAVSDASGLYQVTNLPVGTYSVAAELQGFRKAERTGFELAADGRITADFGLEVGGLAETVQVQAVLGEVVNRTSGEIARTIDGDQVRELALSGRNYLELASLIPGAVQTQDDQMDTTTSLSTTGTTINGSRGNTNSLTIDGGFNLDSGSNGSQINNVGLDFIEQVRIQTSNFSAEYGRNSGAAINVVTRSGTNRYRGSLFDMVRNQRMDAANYFSPRDPDTGKKIKGQLDFQDYGGSLGGPIIRNRLFFFGGVEFKRLDRVDGPFRRTLPTMAELRGDFSARIAGPDGIPGNADDNNIANQLIDPVTREPFPGDVIPQSRLTPDGLAIARVYEAMIGRALQYSSTPTGNNATYQLDFPFKSRQEIARFDYRFRDDQSVYLRFLHDMYDLIEPRGTFIGSDLPTIPTQRRRPGFGYQVSHSWIIQRDVVNEMKLNASWNGQRIPPFGDSWQRDTYGFQFPQVFSGGRYNEGIPDVTFSGTGAPAELRGPSQSLLSPTTDITATNSITWLKGRHSMRGGFLVTRNRKDQNGRFPYTGVVNFNPSGNPNSTGLAFADALLGNFRSYSEGADDPLGFFRFTQYAAFVSDTWRPTSNLSVELGFRYELASPTYSQQNNLVNFDPALYDPNAAIRLNRNGTVIPNSGNPFTGLIRAGDGIPEDQLDRVTVDERAAALIPTGAPRGLYPTHHLYMPRISAAYSLNERTVLRGGFGVFHDKPEGNIIFSQVNLPPFLPSVNVENGNLANPLAGRAASEAVLGTVNAIDPNLDIPRQLNYSISVQRELWGGHFAEVAYVGNRGRNQLWFPEINQPSFDALVANAAIPVAADRANTNFLRPYRGYSSIRQRRSDAFSDYNGFQLYLNKRRGEIRYTVSYTLSKATGNASGFGDNPTPADDPLGDPAYHTGPLSYDRRHVLITTWTYQPRLFRDRGDVLGWLLGGWELSGRTRWQSGQYLTPNGNTSIGTRRADYVGGEISADNRSAERWFNTDAFTAAPDTRRGTATVGMIEGPHWFQVDPSLRKNFTVRGETRLQVRADIFNVFNRVNFQNPNVTTTAAAYGQISAARPARQMQLSLRLDF